jgi:hypothetical protein
LAGTAATGKEIAFSGIHHKTAKILFHARPPHSYYLSAASAGVLWDCHVDWLFAVIKIFFASLHHSRYALKTFTPNVAVM